VANWNRVSGYTIINYGYLYGVGGAVITYFHAWPALVFLLIAWSAHLGKMLVMEYRD
jgi:hypothetical protein